MGSDARAACGHTAAGEGVEIEADANRGASWRDVDEVLFENLRNLRREIAAERGMPAYVIMHDATLRELASVRPQQCTR